MSFRGMVEQELKLLGLNDIDIKVYLMLLKLGESLASEIASKADIPRASIYDILERLEQEGLVSHIVKDFKKYFSAAEPKTIVKSLEYKKQRINSIMPELEDLKNKETAESLKAEIYDGVKGMETIMNQILEEKEMYVMGASRKTPEVMPYFMDKWHRERIKRKINVKIIYNDTPEIRESYKKAKNILGIGKFWDARFLNVKVSTPIMTIVFGNRIMLATWKKDKPSAVLITGKDIAETYKQYILSLWKIARK
jgi:sugar-specific transcriptional regulator TrmB